MYVEVEFAFEIVGAEFSEVSFVPDNNVGETDFVKARPAGKESVDGRGKVFQVLVDEVAYRGGWCGVRLVETTTRDVTSDGGSELGMTVLMVVVLKLVSIIVAAAHEPAAASRPLCDSLPGRCVL